jgi:regulator of cell morphogenesis and NO signaling
MSKAIIDPGTASDAGTATGHSTIDLRQAVAAVVLEHPECAPVFQRHRIDFCCKGELSVGAACAERRVDREALVVELNRAIDERRGSVPNDARAMSTAALVAHIVSTHHAYLRRTLPFLCALAEKVGHVHGKRQPKLRALAAVVGALNETLIPHLDEEEQTLFPALMMKGADHIALARDLRSMRHDHLAVGKLLDRLREESDDYLVPEWACNSYRTLFAELANLESDTLRHVHLENHVLALRFHADAVDAPGSRPAHAAG